MFEGRVGVQPPFLDLILSKTCIQHIFTFFYLYVKHFKVFFIKNMVMQKKTRLIWDEKNGLSTKIFYSSLEIHILFK
jgi:hypothetical protein